MSSASLARGRPLCCWESLATDALLAALAAGQLQAALIGQGRYERPPPDLEALLVAREPVVVAVHPSHPLASRGSVPLAALREEPMVTLTRASKLRSTLETACQAAGFAPGSPLRPATWA